MKIKPVLQPLFVSFLYVLLYMLKSKPKLNPILTCTCPKVQDPKQISGEKNLVDWYYFWLPEP